VVRRGSLSTERLMACWQQQQHATQSVDQCHGRYLAVKLGAEVADLSEVMRFASIKAPPRSSIG
jgi:TetR/AcrR family transcriptional repressor of nem operon